MNKFEDGTVRPSANKPRVQAMRNVKTSEVLYQVSGRVVVATATTAATFRNSDVLRMS